MLEIESAYLKAFFKTCLIEEEGNGLKGQRPEFAESTISPS
jgi:hypothetical protein